MAGPEKWVSLAKRCEALTEPDMLRLCGMARAILAEEPNVHSIEAPVVVCGDIHGQFFDLLKIFRTGGDLPMTKYIFLGDYVDRGYYSLETFTLLLTLKVNNPTQITLLRGNHESRQITQVYGFYDECLAKYGSPTVWRHCCQVFDLLSLGAIINGRVLCIHGGLSPHITTIDDIRILQRNQEIPAEGGFCDIMWSDPDDIDDWAISPRGAGWLFGANVASDFLFVNGLTLVARAHQLVHEGFKFMFAEQSIVTVWSAPNYCYRCGNVAAIMEVKDPFNITNDSFRIFDAVPDDQRKVPNPSSGRYFV